MIRMPIVSPKLESASPFYGDCRCNQADGSGIKGVCLRGYGSYASLLASTQHDMLGNK